VIFGANSPIAAFGARTLVEHMLDPLTIGADIQFTATGLTVTPGTPVTVYDKGEPYVAFTTLDDRGNGVYRCYFRNGVSHIDASGKIQYSQSADYGATWGAPVDAIDTIGVDDRDPVVGVISGVSSLFWVRYLSETAMQIFSVPVDGGAVSNVFGYPLEGGAYVTSLGGCCDNGAAIVSYGGPNGTAGWLVTMVAHRDVYWMPPAVYGADIYRIYEPSILRVIGGGLVVVARTGLNGTAVGPLLCLRSLDNGATWGNAQLFPGFKGTAPIVLCLSTGTLIVVSNKVDVGGRPIYLSYSTDDGATWSTPTFIVNPADSDSGYCGLIEVDSTHVLISYYVNYYHYIRVIPVTIESA